MLLANSSAFAEGHNGTTELRTETFTRRKYARIRLVDTGVRTPTRNPAAKRAPVPFTVILEPLHFGVLPSSVVPTLLCLLPVVACAALMVAPINRYLERIAAKAREEISTAKDE